MEEQEKVKPNYIGDYYKRGGTEIKHENIITNLEHEEQIKMFKSYYTREASKLQKLKDEISNLETKYKIDDKSIIFNTPVIKFVYNNVYFDESGVVCDSSEADIIIRLNYKSNTCIMYKGVYVPTMSILSYNIKYTINTACTKMSIKYLSMRCDDIFAEKSYLYSIDGTVERTDYSIKFNDDVAKYVLSNLFDKELNDIKNMSGILHNLRQFPAWIEILLKTGTAEEIQSFSNKNYKSLLDAYGIDKSVADALTKENKLDAYKKALRELKSSSSCSYLNVSESFKPIEIAKMQEVVDNYTDDFKIYNIISRWAGADYLSILISSYIHYPILNRYYTPYEFAEYICSGAVNQGYTSIYNMIQTLSDYLRMCEDNNVIPYYDTRQLEVEHNIVSRNNKIRVEAEQELKFVDQYKDFKPWTSPDKKWTIIAPKCTNDLIVEGSQMSNCVAGYIGRVASGVCKIYFMRSTKTPEQSYMTIEVRGDVMYQYKLYKNRDIKETDRVILSQFMEDRKLKWNY